MAIVVGAGIGFWIISELWSDEFLVFEDIHVHGGLANQLPSGKRLAGRIGSHFDNLTASIERLRDKDDAALKPNAELPNLEIPGAQVTVQAVVELARRVLRVRERRIGGDIFISATSLAPPPSPSFLVGATDCGKAAPVYVVVRLSSNRGELAEPVEALVCPAKAADGKGDGAALDSHVLESLLQVATLRAYERVYPCGIAAYYFHNWHRRSLDGRMLDPGFRRTNLMISACLLRSGQAEAAHANHLLGRIRQHSNQSEQALDYFAAAELLHWRAQSWWRQWLHEWGWWRVKYPPDFYGHWGSALLDKGRADVALAKFMEQTKQQRDSSLGYIGMGNALKVKARANDRVNGEMLRAALDVYCRGALKKRYDTEIRHALADFLEENHIIVGRCPDTNPDDVDLASSLGARIPQRVRSDPALAYAIRQRLKTVDLMPTEPRYGLALGRALRKSAQDEEAAVKVLERTLVFSVGTSWEIYAELAASYSMMKRPEKAAETLRRARSALAHIAEQEPFNAEARYHAALASLKLKEPYTAYDWATRAAARDPTYQPALLAQACAEWRRGRQGHARDRLAAALLLEDGKAGIDFVDGGLKTCIKEIAGVEDPSSQ
ncbi:MAG TPA: hypothetical protein VJ890_15330 [Vineibacter sp.]|nr:hypothetical protein [Vineibacter sp.]